MPHLFGLQLPLFCFFEGRQLIVRETISFVYVLKYFSLNKVLDIFNLIEFGELAPV